MKLLNFAQNLCELSEGTRASPKKYEYNVRKKTLTFLLTNETNPYPFDLLVLESLITLASLKQQYLMKKQHFTNKND